MDHTQILLRPVVTEKATFLRDGASQVAFFVHPDANKIEKYQEGRGNRLQCESD